jgi:hypothetical protein
MVNSQFSVSTTISSSCDKITQMRSSAIAGNANVAITKNITQINTLKDLVDIDGKGSDVDLTHWDVSHVSNANKAFVNALCQCLG